MAPSAWFMTSEARRGADAGVPAPWTVIDDGIAVSMPVPSAESVGLGWLLRLRWAAVAVQAVLITAASVVWGVPPHVSILAACVVVAAVSNGALAWARKGVEASTWAIPAALLLDVALLTVMLAASGGAMNPFSVFYLVHVALAAVLLHGRAVGVFTLVTCGAFGSLFFATPPDPMAGMHHPGALDMGLHLKGMWFSYTVAAGLVSYFVSKASRALEGRERELSQLRDRTARATRLASLGELAAGAAHELGTPLATIAVIAGELTRSASAVDGTALLEDAQELRRQAERCRGILGRMAARSGDPQGEAPQWVLLPALLESIAREAGEETWGHVSVHCEGADRVRIPVVAVSQATVNLLRNAVDATAAAGREDKVTLRLAVVDARLGIEVSDRGAGLDGDAAKRIAEPFFTTKGPANGLGLGLFLVRTLAARLGGQLAVRSTPGEGASFRLDLPVSPVEA